MSIPYKFESFCTNIQITGAETSNISYRYKRITKQLNTDFWNTQSDTSHSLYAGSYGRKTAIHISDIDMLFQLPFEEYEKYNNYSGNGQSALLQAVRESIKKTYSVTNIGADGQVIVVPFEDGITFEVVPAFINTSGSFTFPDSNNGGKWKTTNPKSEINAIRESDIEYNYNLKRLCRMARSWRDQWNAPMGGLLIDTLSYQFLKIWKYKNRSYAFYDWMTRDFFEYLKNQSSEKKYWIAPGSGQYVWRTGDFEYKALRCYNIAEEAIDYERKEMPYSANVKWKEIYGSKFTG